MDFDAPPAQAKNQTAKKEEKSQAVAQSGPKESVEPKYLAICEELLTNTVKTDAFQSKELVDFLLIFRSIYSQDFGADEVAAALLREVYLETEVPDRERLKELESEGASRAAAAGVVKALNAHEIRAQMYGEADAAPAGGWSEG